MEEGASYFVPYPKQPQPNGQDLVYFFIFLRKKIDGLSTIIQVSIPILLKLPSRVRHHSKKVLQCKHYEE
jgi:hypothetical protein